MSKKSGFVFDKDGICIKKYNGFDLRVNIPTKVKEIGMLAFFECEFLEFVYIHKNIELIGSLCFPNVSSYPNFSRLSLFCEHESKPKSWDDKWCNELSDIHWNCRKNKNYIYSIQNEEITILKYLGSEEEVRVPDFIDGKPVRIIGTFAFRTDCSKRVILPDTIKLIEEYAFFDFIRINRSYENESIYHNVMRFAHRIESVSVPNLSVKIQIGELECDSVFNRPLCGIEILYRTID